LAATALLSACGPASHLRLNLRTVSVTVPRVVAPAVALVPPSLPPAVALPPIPPIANQLPVAPPPAPPANPCPTASQLATPAHAASVVVDKPPFSQVFEQRSTGDVTTSTGKTSLAGTVQVRIADLPDSTASNGQQVKAWGIVQWDPVRKTRAIEVYQLVLPSSAPGAVDPGVYLVGLGWSDPVRGKVTFQPVGNGLQVLPSPVAIASTPAQYASIATDPNTLTTLQLVRNVVGRHRVDVCGQLVDTWTVQMTGTLTTPDAQWQVTWNQQIATAYGAVDVEEQLALQDTAHGVTWTRHLVNTTVPKEAR
jgi:hypothetical protein